MTSTLKATILVAALAAAFAAPAAGPRAGGNVASPQRLAASPPAPARESEIHPAQSDLLRAQAEALRLWNRCIQTASDASQCGPAPTVGASVPQATTPTHVDFACMVACKSKGGPEESCSRQCSY